MVAQPYSADVLHQTGSQRRFTGQALSEIAFPLGGIGAGALSLGGRGNLRDFEIFGHPDKGRDIPFTFFALWVKAAGQEPVVKLLEREALPPFSSGFGSPQAQWRGVGRFAEAVFTGEYPTATLELHDPRVPVHATLTAWNPFIPGNVFDSALPAALFTWTFTNPTDEPVELTLAASMCNPLQVTNEKGHKTAQGGVNRYQEGAGLRGVVFTHPEIAADAPDFGTATLVTPWQGELDVLTHWYRGGWWDNSHLFIDDLTADGRLTPLLEATPSTGRHPDSATLAIPVTLAPGASVSLPIWIVWHFPRLANPWMREEANPPKVLDTWVGKHFTDAWAVAEYLRREHDRLRQETERWRTAIFGSTLPDYVLDAVTSQASIIRTPTCFLLADGSFFGWEGCSDHHGCCPGSCTHVWNYEQALAFLFPSLERSMRETEFLHNTDERGHMAFRTQLPPGSFHWDFLPAVDGQMGVVMQVYRDWQLSGDDAFLRAIWPKVKLALEYAWTMTPERMSAVKTGEGRSIDCLWDLNKDGVIEGEQHNTYDIEFFGPNTLGTVMYLGALRACAAMARHLGEPEKAAEYLALYERGRATVDAELWNGEYYVQQVEVIPEVSVREALQSPESADCGPTCACKQSPGGKASARNGGAMPKYQYGAGCLSDQLLGQVNAHIYGLGYLLDPAKVRAAVGSIFAYNFRARMGDFNNVQRVYAVNDEAGLLLCSWPHGNRPTLPFVYSDEVWTGIEYQVAAHLIYEGWVEEGLTVVKAVRDRYAGYNRNPWNEVECGHHYARAMASWGVKLALDGFTYSLPEARLGFAPRLHNREYRTVWNTGAGWGRYTQQGGAFTLEVLYGTQPLQRLDLADLPAGAVTVTGPHGPIPATREGQAVVFAEPMVLKVGEKITITIS